MYVNGMWQWSVVRVRVIVLQGQLIIEHYDVSNMSTLCAHYDVNIMSQQNPSNLYITLIIHYEK